MDELLLSTVTPVYRGAAHLEELVQELDLLRNELSKGDGPLRLIESIFVDDGSEDGSAELLGRLQERHPWVRLVSLSRNFGQHPATVAGVLHSSGDWVATLDEDGQHPPASLVSLLVHAAETHADLVYAEPLGGVHGSAMRDASSRLYKAVVSRLLGDSRIRQFNSFRLVRGSVARAAGAVSTHETYFDVALGWFTNRVSSLPMELHDPRPDVKSGSGYDLRSLVSHARRMLISSDVKVLRLGASLGLAGLATSALAATLTLLLWLFQREQFHEVRGWLSLFMGILFFGGLTALLSGIVLEYISTLVRLAQGKPTFFVVDRSKDHLLAAFAARQAQR